MISPPISFQFQNRLDFGGAGAGAAEGTCSFIVAADSSVDGLEERHDARNFEQEKIVA